jgi:hypothetical protein
MSDRRYNEDEVAAIFRVAAEQQQTALGSASPTSNAPLASAQGMTLGQLQEIGREVGIPADLVARAAQAIDTRGRPMVRRFLGLPIGVGRTVPLQRRLTDAEWERLVVDLRETFDARGHLKQEGSFRQWTNGNLQALLEPTPVGHQLRMRTLKGDAYAMITAGLAMLGFSAFTAIAVSGGSGGSTSLLLSLVGLGMFGVGALRLPGWAKRRQKQMEEIAARLTDTTRP